MMPVAPIHAFQLAQPQVSLVNQSGGFGGDSLAGHESGRNGQHFLVSPAHDQVERRLITGLPPAEQRSDVRRFVSLGMSQIPVSAGAKSTSNTPHRYA